MYGRRRCFELKQKLNIKKTLISQLRSSAQQKRPHSTEQGESPATGAALDLLQIKNLYKVERLNTRLGIMSMNGFMSKDYIYICLLKLKIDY